MNTQLNFGAWDSKMEVWTSFMIIDNAFYARDWFNGVWIRDDEQKRFKLRRCKEQKKAKLPKILSKVEE